MNKQEELDKAFTRFILVCISSEAIAQRLLSAERLDIKQLANNATDIVNSPIDLLYADIIDNFRDLELNMVVNEEMEEDELTEDEEWVDMVTDLVEQIKEHYYLTNK